MPHILSIVPTPILNKHLAKEAHAQVYSALNSKILRRPAHCSFCRKRSSSWGIHAHHYDYSKPLDVTWVCVSCHGRIHSQANKLFIKQLTEQAAK